MAVNEDIVGGLKSALDRGQSLQAAMMALYNSGYKKEEIEEAARIVVQSSQGVSPQQAKPMQQPQRAQVPLAKPVEAKAYKPIPQQQFIPQKAIMQKPMPVLKKPSLPVSNLPFQVPEYTPPATPIQAPMQKVSNYGVPPSKEKIKEPKTSKEKAIILTLVFLLVFLFAILGMIFIFKQQLIDFFSTFFA